MNDNDAKGEGNQIAFEARVYDSRLGSFLSMDPIAQNHPFQTPYAFAANSPIMFIDVLGMGPGDPIKHTVIKGDNLSKISRKYGVSINDLVSMNGIRDKHKIKPGQVLSVNPEADFSNNPRGGYKNPDNPFGKEVEISTISKVGTSFITGSSEENSIIVGGGALKSVQNWSEVKVRVNELVGRVKADGNAFPGEAYQTSFSAGSLPVNIAMGVIEFYDKLGKENPWKNNRLNSPIHVLGSFGISIRVNANGTTATISVYDSKTMKSFSDGNLKGEENRKRKDYFLTQLTNTYQRYLWNINL